MSKELTYTIMNFDADGKRLWVKFDNGTKAEISLHEPLPKSISDLDKIVRTHAPSVEQLEAAESTVDLGFITQAVGRARTCERFSFAKAQQPPASIDTAPVLTGPGGDPVATTIPLVAAASAKVEVL